MRIMFALFVHTYLDRHYPKWDDSTIVGVVYGIAFAACLVQDMVEMIFHP